MSLIFVLLVLFLAVEAHTDSQAFHWLSFLRKGDYTKAGNNPVCIQSCWTVSVGQCNSAALPLLCSISLFGPPFPFHGVPHFFDFFFFFFTNLSPARLLSWS